MGDFFGNLWQGLIGNGNGGGADGGGSVGGGIGNFANQFATGFGGGSGTTPMSMFGGGVQGGAPTGQAQTLEDINPFQGLPGATVSASPFESNNKQWTSNGPQSNWSTPVSNQQYFPQPWGSPNS
jgi:hypothetical protein